jgi:hypothetical protein
VGARAPVFKDHPTEGSADVTGRMKKAFLELHIDTDRTTI